jgi:hypothetical protein
MEADDFEHVLIIGTGVAELSSSKTAQVALSCSS